MSVTCREDDFKIVNANRNYDDIQKLALHHLSTPQCHVFAVGVCNYHVECIDRQTIESQPATC